MVTVRPGPVVNHTGFRALWKRRRSTGGHKEKTQEWAAFFAVEFTGIPLDNGIIYCRVVSICQH